MREILDRITQDVADESIVTHAPYGGIQYGGTVVATLENPEMRRLLGLNMYYEEKASQAEKVASDNRGNDEDAYNQARVEADEYAALANAVETVFWYSVKKEHNLFGKYAVGVTEDYQIYFADDPRKCNCEERPTRAAGGFPGLDVSDLGMGMMVIEVRSSDGFSPREPRFGSEIPGLGIRGIELPGGGFMLVEKTTRGSESLSDFLSSLLRRRRR